MWILPSALENCFTVWAYHFILFISRCYQKITHLAIELEIFTQKRQRKKQSW